MTKAQKQVGTSATAMEHRAARMSAMWKTGMLIVGAAVVKFGVSSVKAFKEAQLVTAQTEAVLKSTGGAANVTKDQVLDLASAIRDYSGVEDEAIQSGENMLLTSTNIRNEVGKGNDIFTQTTKTMVDMSVVLEQDVGGRPGLRARERTL